MGNWASWKIHNHWEDANKSMNKIMSESKGIIVDANITKDTLHVSILGLITTEFNISLSEMMHPWYIAYPPYLRRSKDKNLIMVGNKFTINLAKSIIFKTLRSQYKWELTDSSIKKFINELQIPKHAQSEIDTISNLKINQIKNIVDTIPYSGDVEHWRFYTTIEAIVKREIFDIINNNPDINRTQYTIQYTLRKFYGRNVEYADTEFEKSIISRKVILPFKAPREIINNNILTLTATPQSDKAGKVAELSVNTIIGNDYKVTAVPLSPHSITNLINPFPERIHENREVVLRAVSQSLNLAKPELPIVKSAMEVMEENR